MAAAEDDLPFTINIVGEHTQQTWKGEFRARRFLTHRQRLAKDKLYREFMGNNPENAEFVSHQTSLILAECAVGLSKVAQFWSESNGGQDLVDENIIVKVWEEMRKIQGDAVKHLEKKGDEAKEELKKVADESSK